MIAGASSSGSDAGHEPDAVRSTATPSPPSTNSGALSERMCSSSRVPDLGLIGTIGTPAASAPTTATHVCSEFSAHTATRAAPATRSATAPAAACSAS